MCERTHRFKALRSEKPGFHEARNPSLSKYSRATPLVPLHADVRIVRRALRHARRRPRALTPSPGRSTRRFEAGVFAGAERVFARRHIWYIVFEYFPSLMVVSTPADEVGGALQRSQPLPLALSPPRRVRPFLWIPLQIHQSADPAPSA